MIFKELDVILKNKGGEKMEIKEVLKIERKKHGYTQQQIADKLRMARGSYAKYETGDNTPTLDNLMKLADLYKVSLDYLAGRYNRKRKSPEVRERTTGHKKCEVQAKDTSRENIKLRLKMQKRYKQKSKCIACIVHFFAKKKQRLFH